MRRKKAHNRTLENVSHGKGKDERRQSSGSGVRARQLVRRLSSSLQVDEKKEGSGSVLPVGVRECVGVCVCVCSASVVYRYFYVGSNQTKRSER